VKAFWHDGEIVSAETEETASRAWLPL